MGKRFTAYDLPLALFLVSAIVGILPAYNRTLCLVTLGVLLAGGALFAALSRLINSHSRWDTASLVVACVSALVSLYYVTQLGHMGFAEKIAPLAQAARWIARLTPDLAFWKPLGNTIGTFVEGLIFITLGLLLVERRSSRRGLLLAGLGVTGLALLFSASRGAWLAVMGAGLLWAALYWKPARWLVYSGAAGLVALAVYAWVLGDFNAIYDLPLVGGMLGQLFVRPDRLEVYYNSLALIKDVPFTGIGLGGQFGMVYSRYELLLHVPFLYYAHNLFLEIWLEQGLLGICAWIWLVVSIFTTARRWRMMFEPRTRIHFESTWIGLSAVLMHGLTDARQAQAQLTWLPFFILLGLNAALVLRAQALPQLKEAWLDRLPAAVAAAFLLLVLISAWPLPATLRANRASVIQQRAELADEEDLLNEADRLFETALDVEADNRTSNQRLGLIALSRQDFDHAIQHLSAAYQKDARLPGTRRALGLAYAFSGRFSEAEPLLRGQLNIVDELNYWGWYYTTNDKTQAGLNAMRMSLALKPNQPNLEQIIRQSQPGGN